jgi:tRNA uridine 5-carboxymethylaminomethyl modification enzyme
LVTRGVSEPYRMFTSRAEYRLTLRVDNADRRLTAWGDAHGLVGAARRDHWAARKAALDEAESLAKQLTATPSEAGRFGLEVNRDGIRRSAWDLLAYPEMEIERLFPLWPELAAIPAPIRDQLAIEAKYAVYTDRQAREIESFRREDGLELPVDLGWDGVPGLSNEVRAKLALARPATLGQAARIDGMTPAALALVLTHAKRAARG